MAPWTKEVYPKTVGPTEYCPPRHLGGNSFVWRELMRWSNNNGTSNATNGKGDECDDDEEEKVNSLDVLDDHHHQVEEEEEGRDDIPPSGSMSSFRLDTEGSISVIDEEEVQPPTMKKNPASSPTGGWRSLTSAELNAVQKLGDTNQYGELTFSTYDLSHVALNTATGANANGSSGSTTIKTAQLGDETSIVTSPSGTTSGILTNSGIISPLRTVFSMDSTTSEDERLHPKSPEEMANDTARLFRRSELSLREKQERQDREEAEQLEKERLIEIDIQERQRNEREDTDTPMMMSLDTSTRSKRQSRKFSGRGIFKTFSRTFSNINSTSSNIGTSSSMRGRSGRGGSSFSGRMSSSGSAGSSQQRPGTMDRRSSTQALAIDRARDVADESDDDEGSVVGNDDDDGSDVDVSCCCSVWHVYV